MTGLIVDSFAGGGGASLAIEAALGRPVDIAINHDAEAVAMHAANHPRTEHYCRNVWQVDPREAVHGRRVDLAWFSPDCKHFSKAKGGRPAKRHIRDLAWVVVLWARRARPRIILLENVEEFREWGPVDLDGRPCPDRKGATFQRWVGELRRLGYRVEWRELRACDYGAPTIRKRLFLVARCDGAPIVWPKLTHGPGLLPYRTAADIIDWSLPCPSIFTRKRPLAEATLRRIARGIQRYVIEAEAPFIIPVGYGERPGQAPRVNAVAEPLGTIVAGGIKHRLVVPSLVKNMTNNIGQASTKPLSTILTGNHHYLVAAFLAKHFGGVTGVGADTPLPTVTTRGTQTQLVTSHLVKFKGTAKDGQPVTAPLHTVQAGGLHYGEVRAFLMKYYGTGGQHQAVDEPLHTVPTKGRFGLVTIAGEEYRIADIGMRMLTPRELFRAQGFPDDYDIVPIVDGKPLTKTAQIRMCGNSVSPPPAKALVHANVGAAVRGEAAA